MIAVSNTMHVSHVTNFPLNIIIIEVTTAMLTLPNFENLQVSTLSDLITFRVVCREVWSIPNGLLSGLVAF